MNLSKGMITEDISIEALVEQFPSSVAFLRERGIVCIVCGEPVWGTFKELLTSKGRSEEVESLLQELNQLLHQ